MKRWTIEEVDDSRVTLVDWDDTLWSTAKGLNVDLIEKLKRRRAEGWAIVIWTCRTSMQTNTVMSQRTAIEDIERTLAEAGVELDGILLHDKPCVKLYIGDETRHPDEYATQRIVEPGMYKYAVKVTGAILKADEPTANGNVYSKPLLEQMADQLTDKPVRVDGVIRGHVIESHVRPDGAQIITDLQLDGIDLFSSPPISMGCKTPDGKDGK